MDTFLQTVINSISMSLIYILFALGLTLLLGILYTMNFAHGELYMMGAYVTYFFFGRWGLPYWLVFVLALPIVSLAGVILEKAIFYPMRNRPHLDPAIATFGMIGIWQTTAFVLWGGVPKGVPSIVTGEVTMGALTLPLERVPLMVGSLLMMLFLLFFVHRTKLGRGIRAVQQDPDGAALQGTNIASIRTVTWAVACSLAAAAGVLMAPITYIDPYMGEGMLLKAFAIIVLGGMGSVPGAIVGGFVIGFVDSFGMTYLGTPAYMFTFGIIILVLIFRPKGLMGRL